MQMSLLLDDKKGEKTCLLVENFTQKKKRKRKIVACRKQVYINFSFFSVSLFLSPSLLPYSQLNNSETCQHVYLKFIPKFTIINRVNFQPPRSNPKVTAHRPTITDFETRFLRFPPM